MKYFSLLLHIACIGTTTFGIVGDWFPNVWVGGSTMYWSPNFLAVVFKKQVISQQ